MLVHILHHLVAHGIVILPLGRGFRIGPGDLAILVIGIIGGGDVRTVSVLGIGLGLPRFVQKFGNKLLLVLRLGDGVHLVHGLTLGRFRQLKLELGKHELKTCGRTEFAEGDGTGTRIINLHAHL